MITWKISLTELFSPASISHEVFISFSIGNFASRRERRVQRTGTIIVILWVQCQVIFSSFIFLRRFVCSPQTVPLIFSKTHKSPYRRNTFIHSSRIILSAFGQTCCIFCFLLVLFDLSKPFLNRKRKFDISRWIAQEENFAVWKPHKICKYFARVMLS